VSQIVFQSALAFSMMTWASLIPPLHRYRLLHRSLGEERDESRPVGGVQSGPRKRRYHTGRHDASFDGVSEAFVVAKNVSIPAAGYGFTQFRGSYTFGPQRKVSGTATARRGGFYEGTLRELSWRSRIEFSPRLYAEPTVSWNHIDVP
jgi:hypothetical protein